jgi:integrase
MPEDRRDRFRVGYTFEIDLDELGFPKRIKVQGEPHEQDAISANLKAALEAAPVRPAGEGIPTHQNARKIPSGGREFDSLPTFKMVVDGFLASYQSGKKPAMFKKHQPVLSMLLDVVGDKPVKSLKQADINDFFSLLEKLPPRWRDECKRRGLTVKQLAELEHPETLGPKSFDDTYKACVRAFLKVAKKDWQDQGFPTTLTTDGIEYQGDREEGERQQRAFRQAELERLFCGAEMQGFAADPEMAHRYWLPHVALFTGARVNELCQLNPQTDILEDPETGIHHFWITEDTEGDERIEKSTKNAVSRRKVPIHSKLIELGFLDYVARIRRGGAKLLFPAWKPSRGKASGEAEKWFRQFLRDTGLRDETRGARVVGMHAFRHTLLSRASNANPPVDATSITGHAGEVNAVVRGYQGELSLENKKRILEAIPFKLVFVAPVEMDNFE